MPLEACGSHWYVYVPFSSVTVTVFSPSNGTSVTISSNAGPDQMEVVDVGLVLDLQRVRAGADALGVLAVLLHLDLEAGADLAFELARGCAGCGGGAFGRRRLRGGGLVGATRSPSPLRRQ